MFLVSFVRCLVVCLVLRCLRPSISGTCFAATFVLAKRLKMTSLADVLLCCLTRGEGAQAASDTEVVQRSMGLHRKRIEEHVGVALKTFNKKISLQRQEEPAHHFIVVSLYV